MKISTEKTGKDQNNREKVLISVLILDFFKAQKVVKNVEYLLSQTLAENIEIIVVDNSCSEENFSILRNNVGSKKNVTLLRSEKNVGYTKGNNAAFQHAKGEYILVLNPDIQCRDQDTLEKLVETLQKNDDIGIIAPAQKDPNGLWAMSVRAFPNFFVQVARRIFLRNIPPFSCWVARDEMENMDRTKSQDVDWLQSSFYLLSRQDWQDLGGFNERYFLFLADTKMCWDMWKSGKRVFFDASCTVYSDGIRCSDGGFFDLFRKKSLQIHLKDAMLFAFDHLFEKNPRNG